MMVQPVRCARSPSGVRARFTYVVFVRVGLGAQVGEKWVDDEEHDGVVCDDFLCERKVVGDHKRVEVPAPAPPEGRMYSKSAPAAISLGLNTVS